MASCLPKSKVVKLREDELHIMHLLYPVNVDLIRLSLFRILLLYMVRGHVISRLLAVLYMLMSGLDEKCYSSLKCWVGSIKYMQ